MANQRAWWTLVISQEPNGPHDSTIELSDADKDHIGSCIREDFTEGEIVQDWPDLAWESAGTSEPGDQHADSVHRVAPDATSAHYSLGPIYASPSNDGERWGLELVQINDGEEIGSVHLGIHSDEWTAKECAQHWENHGAFRSATESPTIPDGT